MSDSNMAYPPENELWDVYDENRNLTGRLQRRGDALESGIMTTGYSLP